MRKWLEAAGGVLLFVVGAALLIMTAALLIMSVLHCADATYDRGACEARGGVYVAGGIEVDGRLVRCIAPPQVIEIPERRE